MFGQHVQPVSTGLYPALPLLFILHIARPPINAANWPDNLHASGKTCVHNPASQHGSPFSAIGGRYNRAV
jgi:hypothetical protein